MIIENIQSQEEIDQMNQLIGKLKEKNEALTSTLKPMGEIDILKRLDHIEESLDELKRQITLIFGNYKLIDGKWVLI